jgi:hypothetical protein
LRDFNDADLNNDQFVTKDELTQVLTRLDINELNDLAQLMVQWDFDRYHLDDIV